MLPLEIDVEIVHRREIPTKLSRHESLTMSFLKFQSYTTLFCFTAAIVIAGIGFVADGFSLGILTSIVPRVALDGFRHCQTIQRPDVDFDDHEYRVQIFSTDPLVMVIHSFVSRDEIAHLLRIRYCSQPTLHHSFALMLKVLTASNDNFSASLVYGGKEPRYDPEIRLSESVTLSAEDPVVRRVKRRAEKFQGWRGNSTAMQLPTVQRYHVDGFFDYHFDWEPKRAKENRVTTFMLYLVADCTGGGTNFPYLKRPNDTKWCDAIECTNEGMDGFQGVTFKPRAGSGVFWENFHPNGSGHESVYHAGLPVKSGVKVGLNLWSWDFAWRRHALDSEQEEVSLT